MVMIIVLPVNSEDQYWEQYIIQVCFYVGALVDLMMVPGGLYSVC